MQSQTHTFAVCAYEKNKYLETAVHSVVNQTVKSNVVIVTGTPNEHIYRIAQKYDVPVLVNYSEDAKTGTGNAEFAFRSVNTEFITLVHQDDYYAPEYAEEILKKAKGKDPIIAFTECFEIRKGKRVYRNKLLKVKELMDIGFRIFPRSKFVRKMVLSFGSAICCPAVTYAKKAYTNFEFDDSFSGGCGDWEAWLRLSDLDGDFLCVHKPLVGHRIHEESDTSKLIGNDLRGQDELRILKSRWPEWFACWLFKRYHTACKSNKLD